MAAGPSEHVKKKKKSLLGTNPCARLLGDNITSEMDGRKYLSYLWVGAVVINCWRRFGVGWDCIHAQCRRLGLSLVSMNFAWGHPPLPALLLDYTSGSTSWVKVVGFSLYLCALLHIVLHGNCELAVLGRSVVCLVVLGTVGAQYLGLPKQLWRTKTSRISNNQRPASAWLWHCP